MVASAWSSHVLLKANVRLHLSIMRSCVDTLLASDTLVSVCDSVAEADKKQLKKFPMEEQHFLESFLLLRRLHIKEGMCVEHL